MRREGVSYQEMFRKVKNTLIAERKVIRASGRDTGDQMKLSRDKITDISHKIIETLRKNPRPAHRRRTPTKCGSRSSAIITELLHAEEKVDRLCPRQDPLAETRDPRRQRGVGPAAPHYYSEELKKLGIDLTR